MIEKSSPIWKIPRKYTDLLKRLIKSVLLLQSANLGLRLASRDIARLGSEPRTTLQAYSSDVVFVFQFSKFLEHMKSRNRYVTQLVETDVYVTGVFQVKFMNN